MDRAEPEAAKLRHDLARVPDSFFAEVLMDMVRSATATHSGGQSHPVRVPSKGS